MEIFGLPLHGLVVHAAVVFTPLTALVAIAYAAARGWRWALRWPLLALAVLTVVSVVLAWFSGGAYLDANSALSSSPVVSTHAGRGDVMLWVGIVFSAVAVAAALLLGGPTGLASGRGSKDGLGLTADRGLAALTVLAAVVAIVWVVLTGDAGARAVWG